MVEGGALEIRATKVGEETTLGQIRRMIEGAQEQKAPIERRLDGWAKVYTPVAHVLAGLLWWWSGDALRAITVLIVFCPSRLPSWQQSAAALRSNLVKKGATIESLAKIDTVAFDKTGTLTLGQPKVIAIRSLNGLVEGELLRLAAIAEKFSEHPVGRAIVHAASHSQSLPDPDRIEALAGLGIHAQTGGYQVLMGQTRLLAERGVRISNEVESQVMHLAGPGRTVIPVAVDRHIAGMLVLEDEVRPDAKAVIARLNQLGLRTVLISGDNRTTAERIGAELGIREVHAEVLPAQKAESSSACKQKDARSPSSVMASMMDRPSRPPTSVSQWGWAARMSRLRRPRLRCSPMT